MAYFHLHRTTFPSGWATRLSLLMVVVSVARIHATPFPSGVIPWVEEQASPEANQVTWFKGSESGLLEMGLLDLPPPAWKNILHLPVVRNQLLSNCGAYAPSYYYKTYQEARERGWIRPDPTINPERVMSPGFTFPLTNKGENSGAGLSTVLNVICRHGIATWADMPESSVWWEYPRDDVWAKALPFRGDRVIGFVITNTPGLNALKAHLASGDLAVCAVPVSDNLYNYPHGDGVNNDVLHANTNIVDFHAFTLIGYDDNRTYHDGTGVKSGAFLAVNSWGQGWGVVDPDVGTGGFIWLGYEYMQFKRPLEVGALAMIDRIDYQPETVAVLEVSHSVRNDLQMEIYAGSGWGRTNALSAFPRGGGPLPYHGTLTIDITEFMVDHPEMFHLWAIDWSGPYHSPAVGSIGRFDIHTLDGVIMTNRVVPVTLENSDTSDIPTGWKATRLSIGVLEQEDQPFWGEPLQTPQFTWVDFNGNGHLDFVIFGGFGTNNHAGLYINDGQGRFTLRDDTLPRLNSVIMAWADYNNDGYPDLAVSGRTGSPDLNPVTYLFRNESGLRLVDSGITFPALRQGLAWGDYDQDGDLDLATSTGALYTNQGGTNFVNSGLTLLGGASLPHTSVTWADLNNDGLLDLIINGQINMNIGGAFGGPYHHDPLNPPRVGSPGELLNIHFWHDFNGDGVLDAVANGAIYYDMGIASGWDNPEGWDLWYEASKVVYSNWAGGQIAAADYNHDGLLDLAISGYAGASSDPRFSVFRQETNRYALPNVWDTQGVETFTDIGLQHAGFYGGSVGWGDWDGDGDLDLLAGGYDATFADHLAALASRFADRGQVNQPPDPPRHFVTQQTNASVILQWHPATDDTTPETSMAYEVRVGRAPGQVDVVSPYGLGPLPGNARLIGLPDPTAEPVFWPRLKNTNGIPGIRLRNLAPGRYYWSVRAVDGGMARSPWSTEQAFTITTSGLRNGDVNQDGKVDVADLVRLRKMIAGQISPNTDRADLDMDGVVGESDATILANQILSMGTDDYLPVAEATIGPAGGTLSDGVFALTVPPDTFMDVASLQLYIATGERIQGPGSPPIMWRITGIPTTMTGNLHVSGPDVRTSPTNAIFLALGQTVRPFTAPANDLEPKRAFTHVPGTASAGRLHTTIPADLLHAVQGATPAAQERSSTPATASSTNSPIGTFEIENGYFSNTYSFNTAHFRIFWPELTPAYVINLGIELEQAFAHYQDMGFPFANKRDWAEYPVQVHLRAMKVKNGVSEEGAAIHITDKSAYIELDINRMKNGLLRKSTAYHEFFHLVQGWINPAYSINEAGDQDLRLVSEATATWMERYGAITPTAYDPPSFNENKYKIFDGPHFGARRWPTEAGYAFSSMIEFLANRHSTNIVRSIYERIIARDNPITAIFNSTPTPADRTWYHDYYQAVAAKQVYSGAPMLNFLIASFPPEWPLRQDTYTATTNANPSFTSQLYLGGLGAAGRRFTFSPEAVANLTDTSVLAISLTNPNDDMGLGVIAAQVQADPPGTFTIEDYSTKPERIRMRVRDLKAALPAPPNARVPRRSFTAVASRCDPAQRHQFAFSTLHMAVVDQLLGSYPIPIFNHGLLWWNNDIIIVPEFEINARISVSDITGLYDANISQPMPGVNSGSVSVMAYQDGPVSASLFVNTRVVTPSDELFDPGSTVSSTRFTLKSLNGQTYSKRRYLGTELEDQPLVFEGEHLSNGETLTLDEDEDHVYFGITLHYTLEIQNYRYGEPSGTPWEFDLHTTPLFVHLERK